MISDIDLTPTCTILKMPVGAGQFQLRRWGDPEKARSVALLVHGLGAHSAWFEAIARLLTERGLVVFAYDQKGFGSRGSENVHSYMEWVDDLAAVVKILRADHAGKPFFLMGNSMGALVVMATIQMVKVDGIVIFSPGFEGYPATFTLPYKIRAILSSLLAPDRAVSLPYDVDLVTRDEGVRKWLRADELKKMAVPGRMLSELLKLSNRVIASLKSVGVPVLMFTAGVEKIVNNEVNLALYARLQAPTKEHIHMHDSWHDLMFDPDLDQVADACVAWVNARSAVEAAK